MIVKKIKHRGANKPKAWQIGDLVEYIRGSHKTKNHEKVEYAGGRNFLTDTHCGQKGEMIALAQESTRSKMPVTHWIFSWREGEQPSRRQVDEVVDMFLENMELVGHQTIFALHQDTNNYHMHIAVNRMNEVTGKVVLPFNGFDIEASHKIVALIEHKQGWKSEEGARYTVERGELVRTKQRAKPRVTPKQKALEFEHATGEKSAQRIAQERGHKIISEAKTWQELHEKLAKVDLRFEKKGSGGVVFVASLEGDIAVKASSIDRKFSMGKLCKRLGDFAEGIYPKTTKKHPPEPVSATSLPEWKIYQAECRNMEAEQKETSEETELEALKKYHKEQRENATTKLKKHGLSVLNIARHYLSKQQKEELDELRKSSKNKAHRRRKRPRFETWLRNRGQHKQADLWRYRASSKKRHPLQDFLDEAWCKIVLAPKSPKSMRNLIETYHAYYEDFKSQQPSILAENSSHIDSMIALRMRATGHSPEAVYRTLLKCTPPLHLNKLKREGRDWHEYAKRMVIYAFGVGGTRDLRVHEKDVEWWKMAEKPFSQEQEIWMNTLYENKNRPR